MRLFISLFLFLISLNLFAEGTPNEMLEGKAVVRLFLSPGGVVDIKTPIAYSTVLEKENHFTCSYLEAEVKNMDSGLRLRDIEIKNILGIDQKVIVKDVDAFKNKKSKTGTALITINQIEKKISLKFILMGLNKLKATFFLNLSDFNIKPPEYLGAKVKNQLRVIAFLNFEPSKVEVKAKRSKRPAKVKKASNLKH